MKFVKNPIRYCYLSILRQRRIRHKVTVKCFFALLIFGVCFCCICYISIRQQPYSYLGWGWVLWGCGSGIIIIRRMPQLIGIFFLCRYQLELFLMENCISVPHVTWQGKNVISFSWEKICWLRNVLKNCLWAQWKSQSTKIRKWLLP